MSTNRNNNRRGGGKGGGNFGRAKALNQKYGTPLPVVLAPSALHPSHVPPPSRFPPLQPVPAPTISETFIKAIKNAKYHFARPEVPVCKGVFDKRTRSVWVPDKTDRMILFERGFFGKGSLSRSDPSWHTRRVKVVLQELQAERGQNRGLTAEEVTALRRKERKQFKIDRAQAILDASLAAEAVLKSAAGGVASGVSSPAVTPAATLPPSQDDEEDNLPGPSNPLKRITSSSSIATTATTTTAQPTSAIPSFEEYAHALPEGTTRLTPQTFLVRPTRPSVQVGRKPRPARPAGQAGGDKGKEPEEVDPEVERAEAERKEKAREEWARAKEEERLLEEQVEDMEHLQLSLEEAFFLAWGLGCLAITNPDTGKDLSPPEFLALIFTLPQALRLPPNSLTNPMTRPDHPFLVAYAAYHHYRSYGWVVKTGIKFCCDFLLYKKGLVFSHAEFALLVIPHYTKQEDRESSPFILPNGDPMSWQWLNTVNRVNTQVKKTLILAYVVIPPLDSLDAKDWRSPERLLSKFAVREVTIRRFVAARMRD